MPLLRVVISLLHQDLKWLGAWAMMVVTGMKVAGMMEAGMMEAGMTVAGMAVMVA
jgi:hypothetical protein